MQLKREVKAWFEPIHSEGGRYVGLDGLRGLAMMMVILIHLHLLGIGWIGLSSFFVLSGFLITRVLMSDQDKSDSTVDYLKRFYGRRAMRIFPIYYVYLTILLIGTYFIGRLEDVREHIPYAYLYVFNWYQVSAEPHHTRMLNHLWSLSVEEQFYLVWPFFLVVLPRRFLPQVATLLVLAGPVLRFWGGSLMPEVSGQTGTTRPMYVYVMTTSHLDAFALGALINFIHFRPKTWHYIFIVAIAIGLGYWANGTLGHVPWDKYEMFLTLGWPLFQYEGMQHVWGYTLVNIFWFVVICGILDERSKVKRFFSLRILDYLGKRSYSTYIIHYPLLAFFMPYWTKAQEIFGSHLGTLAIMPIYLPIVFILSAAAFRYIEMPMLTLKERLWPDKPKQSSGKAVTISPQK